MKKSTYTRNYVIEIDAPDGKNWFQGITFLQNKKDGKPATGGVYMNVWTNVWADVLPGVGIFTEREARGWLKKADTEGATVRNWNIVSKEMRTYVRPVPTISNIKDLAND